MNYKDKYEKWLSASCVDETIKEELRMLCDEEIEDRFYKDLEFGTGGLRGIMAFGTNRMNLYTVRKATQGVALELLANECENKSVVIAYDSRNNSFEFAKETARVLCANNIKTYLFESLRPTPELSFAVRHLGCARGIVITASHNPKEYNGYKVYGEDGGQIPPETAERIIRYINEVDIFKDVKIDGDKNPVIIGSEVDEAYINAVYNQSFGVDVPDNFKVIYTPIHGAGNIPVQNILKKIGVRDLFVVPEQEKPDGNFSTVKSPNPEEASAFLIAVDYAKSLNADLVLGTDPDSDRVGVVVKNSDGEYIVLNGNQTGVLLCEYILRKCKENNKLPQNATVIKTIVTSDMVTAVGKKYGAVVKDVLTGFKYIGEQIKVFEEENDAERFVFGLEESYGYLRGTYCRDKDAVVSCMLITEMAAEYKSAGKTLYDALISLYEEYGYYSESLKTIKLDGIDGADKIQKLMSFFRNNDMEFQVKEKIDYKKGVDDLPKSDVLKFITDDGWFAVRPSGTEPKIKFYFGVTAENENKARQRSDILKKSVLKLCDKVVDSF